ncbi:type II secretion system protein E [Pseudarthrobacter chlorophenolicus A6]|uniref:Type II secretion system protein E n=1 Tax=Pseudarthrobacter chlorophenolicus (strain ATCC 700700 / DSM 12829 / CIP 107037 / JCM 12360 / KCTC 9906 / NCIMB 13794 / A6) TaxID=452863 RepID=B8HCI8_PSECP|nr:type II secretion system protein E [Pseudarthrobacter chlorophenolicus A6]SDQ78479.1 pilus assembly protein CpaF [Pseudarthrobacter chlorophenolicus]
MNLSRRLEKVRGAEPTMSAAEPEQKNPFAPQPAPVEPATLGRIHEAKSAEVAEVVELTPTAAVASGALSALKERASQSLYERLGARITDSSLEEAELHQYVKDELKIVVDEEQVPLTSAERQRLIREIIDDVLGHGPIQRFLDDPSITEVMVNRFDQVYIERAGKLTLTDTKFSSDEALRRVIERIVSKVGRRIDESSPLVDARLADGSRVNAIIPPLAVNGPALTIRKFGGDALTVDKLIAFGSLSPEMAELLQACVLARMNIIVSGGTGTGKTTLLNALSSFIPTSDRIVTIEDAVELQLQQDHVVRLESRPANIEGKGEIAIRDLVRNSLRMRPDRIVVGEVRGGECLDMLQAMNTGHDGSLSTVHANSPRDAIARLETLVLMAGMDLPLRAVREQVASAVNLIVHISRLRDGTRRVTHVTEVQGMEGDIVTLQDAFVFDYAAGIDSTGRFLGKPVPTGVRPRFTDRFADLGIRVSPHIFGADPVRGR